MVAGLTVLLAAAGVVGYLLLQGSQTGDPAAQGSGDAGRSGHHTAHGGRSPSGHPTTTAPSSPTPTSPTSSPPAAPPGVGGGSAKAFVGRYYAALPSDTRSAWAALSPGFQNQIGGYDRYVGFWSTISQVSLTGAEPAGKGAVDASLTYTRNDGSTSSEVRRIYLERHDSDYLISGDDIVG